MASRRDVREVERRDGLPLAGGRSSRRDPGELRHEVQGQGRRAHFHEEGAQAPRITEVIITDGLRSYGAAMAQLGNSKK